MTRLSRNAGGNGFRLPDIVANLCVDQAWGFIGVSGALHDLSGAYFTNNACQGVFNNVGGGAAVVGNCVNNGHPNDRIGWAFAAGAKFNLTASGDTFGINAAISEGAVGYTMNSSPWSLYNSSTSVGLGWAVDGVFDTGSRVELTRAWSALVGYEHIWNPKWRTSLFGGYVNISYNSAAKDLINNRIVGCGGTDAGLTPGAAATGTAIPPPGSGINGGAATITF